MTSITKKQQPQCWVASSHEPQGNEYSKKSLVFLERMYKQQKCKREQAEENLLEYRKRLIFIQRQFKTTIEKYRKSILSSETQKFHEDIQKIYNQIIINFDQANDATNSFLWKQYQNNHDFMGRKIEEIFTTMNSEIKKYSKISKESYQSIKQQIRKVLDDALEIEQNSIAQAHKLKKLEFNYRVLREERDLLINENISRKNKVKSLVDWNRMNLLESQRDSSSVSGRKVHFSKMNNLRVDSKTEQTVSEKQEKPSVHNARTTKVSTPNFRPQTSRSPTPNIFGFPLDNSQSSKQRVFNSRKAAFIKNKVNKEEAKAVEKKAEVKKAVNKLSKQKGTISSIQIGSRQLTKCSCGFQKQSYEKTIEHLNKSIRRYKNKIYQLQKIINFSENRSKAINDALKQAIEQSYELFQQDKNSSDTKTRFQLILESEKLLQTLHFLKERLSRVQNPQVSCGWAAYSSIEQLSINQFKD